jgi:cytochrome c oxidase assembly factor CtaG
VLAHTGAGALVPLQLLPATLGGILYALRVQALRGGPRAVPGWRQACFYGGLLVIVTALASPLGHVAEELFLAHMIEHLLIADVGALLLVLGLTGPVLAPLLRIGLLGPLKVLSHPVVALALWTLNLAVWHIPALHEAAVRSEPLHALQHAGFVGGGFGVWMALLGPLPTPAWFGNGARVAYIVAVRMVGAVLANIFVFGGTAFYDVYAPGEAYWGITPEGDQVGGGLDHDGLGVRPDARALLLALPQDGARGRGAPGAARPRRGRGVPLTASAPRARWAPGAGADLRRRLERS